MNPLSKLAHTLIPSEIIKQGNEINERIQAGEHIYNYTIGDFNPACFPIPAALERAIIEAYKDHATNYPPAAGMLVLREAVSAFAQRIQGLNYSPSEILISGGGRPLIYAAYRTLVDPGDKVVYPVPSWNNNHYAHFVEAKHVVIETKAENNFMPTAAELQAHLEGATLLALCSPLNPTGTGFTKEHLSEICQLILDINKKRAGHTKPLYLLYDQIYGQLTFGNVVHHDPVSLHPEMKAYTVFVDGISKAFCATGVRVGWCMGPMEIVEKMRGILSHIGAWSPMAEQVATAKFLSQEEEVTAHIIWMKGELQSRLQAIHEGIEALRKEGLPIHSIVPQGAMYLAVCVGILGKKMKNGSVLSDTDDITSFLLNSASLAIVPFKSFGSVNHETWYRLSVGVCMQEDISAFIGKLRVALQSLQ